MFRLQLFTALSLSLLLVLAGCSGEKTEETSTGEATQSAEQASPGEGKMVATVNSRNITEGQVERERTRMMQEMSGRVSPQQMASMQDDMRQQAVDNLINRALLEQEAERLSIEVTEADIDERFEFIKSNFPSEEEFINRLAGVGATEASLREEVAGGLRIEKLVDERTKDIELPGDPEIRSFYDENPQQFTQPEQVRASHILIKVEAGAAENIKSEKLLSAKNILEEVQAGGDFAGLASKYSECPSSSRGGDLGFFGRGQMVKPFEDAAFSLGRDQLSDVVETRFGYHIIKVTDRKETAKMPFEEAKPNISNYLHQTKRNDTVTAYIEELKKTADIRYHATEEK